MACLGFLVLVMIFDPACSWTTTDTTDTAGYTGWWVTGFYTGETVFSYGTTEETQQGTSNTAETDTAVVEQPTTVKIETTAYVTESEAVEQETTFEKEITTAETESTVKIETTEFGIDSATIETEATTPSARPESSTVKIETTAFQTEVTTVTTAVETESTMKIETTGFGIDSATMETEAATPSAGPESSTVKIETTAFQPEDTAVTTAAETEWTLKIETTAIGIDSTTMETEAATPSAGPESSTVKIETTAFETEVTTAAETKSTIATETTTRSTFSDYRQKRHVKEQTEFQAQTPQEQNQTERQVSALLDYECFTNGTIVVSNVDPSVFKTSFANDSYGVCNTTYSGDFHFLTITNCSLNDDILVVFSNRSNDSDRIIGGRETALFIIRCNDIPENFTKTFILGFSPTDSPVTQAGVVTPHIGLVSAFRDGYIHIDATENKAAVLASVLYWTIDITPAQYFLLPKYCRAISGLNVSDPTALTKDLIIDGCSVDENLVGNFGSVVLKPDTRRLFTTFYVFKFYDSDYVTFACTVLFCMQEQQCRPVCGESIVKRGAQRYFEESAQTFTSLLVIEKDTIHFSKATTERIDVLRVFLLVFFCLSHFIV